MSTEGIRTTHLNVDTVKGVVMLHGHLPGTVVDRAEPAAAYSVLAHEAMVWDAVIKPLLLRRFPLSPRASSKRQEHLPTARSFRTWVTTRSVIQQVFRRADRRGP